MSKHKRASVNTMVWEYSTSVKGSLNMNAHQHYIALHAIKEYNDYCESQESDSEHVSMSICSVSTYSKGVYFKLCVRCKELILKHILYSEGFG